MVVYEVKYRSLKVVPPSFVCNFIVWTWLCRVHYAILSFTSQFGTPSWDWYLLMVDIQNWCVIWIHTRDAKAIWPTICAMVEAANRIGTVPSDLEEVWFSGGRSVACAMTTCPRCCAKQMFGSPTSHCFDAGNAGVHPRSIPKATHSCSSLDSIVQNTVPMTYDNIPKVLAGGVNDLFPSVLHRNANVRKKHAIMTVFLRVVAAIRWQSSRSWSHFGTGSTLKGSFRWSRSVRRCKGLVVGDSWG